jgi:ferredoxin
VGIYEMQAGHVDAELAQLFEDYYQQTYRQLLPQQPPAHRVIPVGESVPTSVDVRPFESARDIILNAQAWGVTDCICRVQQALIGRACEHPVDVCMIFSQTPGAFDQPSSVRPLTQVEALATLDRAADAGLVHSVSNNQRGLWYLCNCCTCACGFLRGLKELGIANVIARSAFVCQVDADLCMGCGDCLPRCSFNALSMPDFTIEINATRCAGCGACTVVCPNHALSLLRRPDEETLAPPETEDAWRAARAASRGLDLAVVQ